MVLHKRLDYGSSGHRVPAMPRVPKSAKGKRSVRKKVETNEMCAFDLLATVAGTLLEAENANSPFNHTTEKDSIKQEKVKSPKAEVFDRRSCSMTTLGSEGFFHNSKRDDTQTSNTVSGHSSIFVMPDNSDKDVFTGKSIVTGARGELGQSLGPILEKCSMDRRSPDSVESCKYKLLDNIMIPLRAENASGSLQAENASGSRGLEEHPMDVDVKPPPLVSSDSSVDIPLCGNHIANSSIPMRGEHKEHDDDENSSGCTHPSTRPFKATGPLCVGDRRIRKLLGSKYSKVATAIVKDEDFSDTEKKPVYRGKRMGYIRQRAQRSSFKRRKLCEHRIISASDREVLGEGTSNSPVNGNIKIEAIDSHEMHGVSGASSSTDQKSSYESGDLRVRFSIKSFKVPELFIEIPESATVGSLKKTVMEAVTAVLGGGVRIGVLQQGKKVRDDNKTLIQAGIRHDDKMENLGFTLDPIPRRRPSLAKSEDFLPPCDDTTKQLTGYPVVVPPSDEGPPIPTLQPPLNALVKCLDSENNSAHSPVDLSSLDKIAANYSQALVPVSAINGEALAVVPLRKLRRAELAQRRIRRPFSVPEVEALVQAVEKLGTGRWRDVKIRAFDNAKHRTYVDLKDKWKTLVHTARISPQQRRGEPVPQVLLDRVLAAHAYWSQQQAKLQIKSLPGEACLLF